MSTIPRIRVFCVDDHPLMREGIAAIIRNESDMQLVAEASTGHEAIQGFREHQPNVTLMDVRMPDMGGIDALLAIRTEFADARVIMLTTFEGDAEIQRALEAGAQGYMLKSMPRKQLVDVIRKVHRGQKHIPNEVAAQLMEHLGAETLSKREVEVLQKVAGGNRNSDIAALLFISEETVKGHVKHIMEKLGASDRTEAVAIGIRRGFIHL
jgi:DNA-binding NarL/FixJ family response regulator